MLSDKQLKALEKGRRTKHPGYLLGKHHTEVTRKKIGLTLLGHVVTSEC